MEIKYIPFLLWIFSGTAKSTNTESRRSLQSISQVIDDVIGDIWRLLEDDRDLAPKFLRLGFHDCVGGCDGCVNMNNPDNNGLEEPINALAGIVNHYEHPNGLSRADIWVIASLTGANFANPRSNTFFEMNFYGRSNCGSSPFGGFDHPLPAVNLDTDDVLDFFFDNFGFNTQETCAILGAHTLGRVHPENSGFVGRRGWTANRHVLDNAYYRGIVGLGNSEFDWVEGAPGWHVVQISNTNRHQWIQGQSGSASTDSGDNDGGGGGSGGGGNFEDDDDFFDGVNDDDFFGKQKELLEEEIEKLIKTETEEDEQSDSIEEEQEEENGGRRKTLARLLAEKITTIDEKIIIADCDDDHDDEDEHPLIMLNADIALVRSFGGDLLSNGDVRCRFKGQNACPIASTLAQMSMYSNNNDLWLYDFKSALEKMVNVGCSSCRRL